MPVLDATALWKTYSGHSVLRDVTLTLRRGERVGLVGNNGSGKSTLARVLCGGETPDEGEIARRRGARIEYLPQEPVLSPEASARETVLASLGEWMAAKIRYDQLTGQIAEFAESATSAASTTSSASGATASGLAEASGDAVDRMITAQAQAADELERQGGWERVHEADATLAHLGIGDPDRKVGTLSGGERRRVALARLLVGAPDLAILDEPTNHLDVPTIEWLEEYLAERFSGALLLITHDRAVLDRVTSRTLELHDGALRSYAGGYASYLEAKALREAQEARGERNRQNFLRKELEWLRRQPKARGTKQKARIERADTALSKRSPRREQSAELRAHAERQGKTILSLSGLQLERDGRFLVEELDLDLSPGQRLGIIGPNGSGKTSLLLALQQELPLAGGELTLGANTQIGYLDQARSGLDPKDSVKDAVAGEAVEVEIGGERLQVGSYLERFLFDWHAQQIQVSELSGGERARVCLARLLWQKSNLLLLDEPTNDLDVATLGALEAMLVQYPGSALIVSHDRWFLDRVATSLLVFEGEGRVAVHAGGYSEYHERQLARAAAEGAGRASSGETRPRAGAQPAKRDARSTSPARAKRLSFKEQRELDGLFERVEDAETRAASLESKLSDPETYKREGDAVPELQRAFGEARDEVGTLTARWEELEARKSEAEAEAETESG